MQQIFVLQCINGLLETPALGFFKIGCWTTSHFYLQNTTKQEQL